MSRFPSDKGGTFKVLGVQASDWEDSDLSLSRIIRLKTEFGERDHIIGLSYTKKPDGFAPLLVFQFNFSWGLIGEGDFYIFVAKAGTKEVGRFVIRRMSSEPTVGFVCAEPDEIREFTVWMASNLNLIGEVHGADGVACNFPIPHDPNFAENLNRVHARMNEYN